MSIEIYYQICIRTPGGQALRGVSRHVSLDEARRHREAIRDTFTPGTPFWIEEVTKTTNCDVRVFDAA